MTDRTAYEKLGPTNMVHASGKVALATEQQMSSAPNPMAHRVGSYVNYLYRALPDDVRGQVPPPPPLCATGTRLVGLHPETGYPMCRDSIFRIRRKRCAEDGGELVERWCLRDDPGKLQSRSSTSSTVSCRNHRTNLRSHCRLPTWRRNSRLD